MTTRLLVAIPLIALLAGCAKPYSAYVNNDAGQPVTARIVLAGSARTLTEQQINPADKGILEVRKSGGVLRLEVDTLGNPGHPAAMDLEPGRTVVHVKAESQSTRARIRLDVVPQ